MTGLTRTAMNANAKGYTEFIESVNIWLPEVERGSSKKTQGEFNDFVAKGGLVNGR